jgi:hypothetical protein
MRERRRHMALMVAIATVSGLILLERDPLACDPSGGQITVDALTRAESGEELDKLVWEQIRQLPDGELVKCRESSSRSVALAAAWEVVCRTMKQPDLELDKDALNRFIGFVEGRVGVSSPEWWEAGLLRAKGTPQRFVLFCIGDLQTPYKGLPFQFHVRQNDRINGDDDHYEPLHAMVSPTIASIIEVSKGWRVTIGDESFVVAESVREQFGDIQERASVHFASNRVYVAFHSGMCGTSKLFCLDRPRGQILWECRVWGHGNLYSHSGGGRECHWVGLRETQDELLVFGLAGDQAYIEGFRVADGVCTFRFGTMYGCWAPLPLTNG